MPFSFDSIRSYFTGERPEPVSPHITPASGIEIEQIHSPSLESPLDKTVLIKASTQQDELQPNEDKEDEAAGRYLFRKELEERHLPEREKRSEQNYSAGNSDEPAKLVARDSAELQAQHAQLNSEPLLRIVEVRAQANPASVESPNTGVGFLASQEKSIREEWQHDLQSGRGNQHDLETYFAGKIDQHNTMIELAVEANPKLQETLPPQINYEQLRSELQQQIQHQQQAPAQAMEIAI